MENAEELVKRHKIIVYPRPYISKPSSSLLDKILALADIEFVNAP